MKINSEVKIQLFLEAVDKCKGDVYLRSIMGDNYNLKSVLSRYIAIGALIKDKAEELELFCANKEDEAIFLKLFAENPEIL